MTQNKTETEVCTKDTCSPCEKGTNDLLIGTGVGAYGTASFLATGALCPTCLIITPAFLALGAYKRMKFNKKQKDTV